MTVLKKEVKEKLLPGELGVSPRIFHVPQRMGDNRGFGLLATNIIPE